MPLDSTLLIAALAASVLGTSLAAWWLYRLNQRVSNIGAQITRTAAVRSEAWRMKLNNDRLAEWQEVTEASIDGGSRAVRAVHKSIADLSFDILESIPTTRDTTRLVRGIHDFAADNAYAAVSVVNRLAGERSRRALYTPKGPKHADGRVVDAGVVADVSLDVGPDTDSNSRTGNVQRD